MRQSRRKSRFCGSLKVFSYGNICLTGYIRASLSWMLRVFLSRHRTALGQHKERVGCYDPNGWERWVPTPATVPPRHPGAPRHDSEEGQVFSFTPSARLRGRAGFGDTANAPHPSSCSSKWDFPSTVTFLTPSGG